MKKTLLLLFFICSLPFVAQVTNEGKPASWKLTKKTNIKAISLSQMDILKIKAEDDINDKIQATPYRVGIAHKVNYGLDNAGTWTQLANGDRLWRILLSSKDAVHLSVVFDKFFIPKGGKVYLFNDDKTDLLGAYTDIQNNEKQVLGTWFVNGDKLWIEYYEPKKVKGQGILNLSSVIHGYRLGHTYQKGYYNEFQKIDESGDCNHDVDCPIGADFEAQKDLLKKSVAFLNMGDGFICTGALVNNTAQDKTPYFLSANHCYERNIGTANAALFSMRFNWISPNPVCATNTSNTNSANFTISGSTLRARNAASDFMLVQINSALNPLWDVTYAGWDRTDTNPSFEVGIHHPSGDIMKISRDNDGASKAISGVANVWRIDGLSSGAGNGWEIGVTEGGSSGSPLFDQNARIIGQLFGGNAACSGTIDNDDYDVYGRFATSWDTGTNAATRLKDWLDPSGTNANTLESFPLLENFALDGAVKSFIPVVACSSSEVTPTITVRNAGSTILTSLTVNWDIDGGTSTVLNWTGSLAKNETDNMVLSAIPVSPGYHVFNVTSTNPNGLIDNNSSNDTYTPAFSIVDSKKIITTQVHLTLTTDDWSDETSWEFKDSNETILYSGGPYDGNFQNNTTFQESFNVSLDECYTFEIFDSAGDGICCGFGIGSYSLKTDDDTLIIDGGNFGSSEGTQMSSVTTLTVNDEFLEQNISIFPNPTTGVLQIKITEWVTDVEYEVYNVLGQTLKSDKLQNNEILDLTDLPSDIYFIKITEIETNRSLVKKIVLNK